jgi:hypothetical protein
MGAATERELQSSASTYAPRRSLLEEKQLDFIGSVFCTQYRCEASFYIEAPGSGKPRPGTGSGVRNLIVRYGEGYTGQDLPFNTSGEREFAVGIPDDWSKEKLLVARVTRTEGTVSSA